MKRWAQALLASALLAFAVLAQEVVPTWTGFHDWRYALLLGALAMGPLGYIRFARKGGDGEFGGRCAIAFIGALLIGVAGLACGLLGPDSVSLARAPGTVLPLPDLGAAAFFPTVDADGIRNGDAVLLLRRRGGQSTPVTPGGRRFWGSYVVESHLRHAAYVEARDERGGRLTVTQPSGGTFLSPTLLFASSESIGGRLLPSDFFAVPAARRRVEAMYLSPETVRGTRAERSIGEHPAVLFAVDDDGGHLLPQGIALSSLGGDVQAGGVLLRATAGAYPELIVSAVPSSAVLWLGGVWLAAGTLWAWEAARNGCHGGS
jgi:hypothetical protein